MYSNFESKEDLFLALLQEASDPEWYGPPRSTGSRATTAGPRRGLRALLGRPAPDAPPRRHVPRDERRRPAQRPDRASGSPATTSASSSELGEGLRELLDAPDADAATLGLLAQSLYVGLLMHGAFGDDVDEDTFARAYEVLAARPPHDDMYG